MPFLGKLLGIRLIVRLGTRLAPAPPELLQAITQVQVTNSGSGQDGFSLTLTLTKQAREFNLLADGLFEPPGRIAIGVLMGVMPEVLIDGVITHHQLTPSEDPGASTLTVIGRDWTAMMDLKDRNETYPNQADNTIVQTILEQNAYAEFVPTPILQVATRGTPTETQTVTQQTSTDLKFVGSLAMRNGFVFYTEPQTFGINRVYFGSEERSAHMQPALTLNMGAASNLTSINFSYDALAEAEPTGDLVDPKTKSVQPIQPVPSAKLPALARSRPIRRTTILRDVAHLRYAEASARLTAAAASAPDAVTASGSIDTLRYGGILRARRLVGVRGVGTNFDGHYYVRSVTHSISRTDYSQSFSLSREGRGALGSVVQV